MIQRWEENFLINADIKYSTTLVKPAFYIVCRSVICILNLDCCFKVRKMASFQLQKVITNRYNLILKIVTWPIKRVSYPLSF